MSSTCSSADGSCAPAALSWRWSWKKEVTISSAKTTPSPSSPNWSNNMVIEEPNQLNIDRSVGDFRYPEQHQFSAGIGLTHETIDYIVDVKGEPDWLREFRHKALDTFLAKPMPTHWASHDLEAINFDAIRYYLSNGQKANRTWEDVPEDMKRTFERLGIPEQERKFLAGVEAQFDSEAVYSNIKKAVGEQGVVFVGSTEGLKHHPEIFRKWFGKSFRSATTNLARSTRPCSAAARSFTCRPASK